MGFSLFNNQLLVPSLGYERPHSHPHPCVKLCSRSNFFSRTFVWTLISNKYASYQIYRGYLSPEYATRGQLTEKLDVYSFGVLVLEIVSGRRNIDFKLPEEKVYLIEWVHTTLFQPPYIHWSQLQSWDAFWFGSYSAFGTKIWKPNVFVVVV
jgi:hypothetical protein